MLATVCVLLSSAPATSSEWVTEQFAIDGGYVAFSLYIPEGGRVELKILHEWTGRTGIEGYWWDSPDFGREGSGFRGTRADGEALYVGVEGSGIDKGDHTPYSGDDYGWQFAASERGTWRIIAALGSSGHSSGVVEFRRTPDVEVRVESAEEYVFFTDSDFGGRVRAGVQQGWVSAFAVQGGEATAHFPNGLFGVFSPWGSGRMEHEGESEDVARDWNILRDRPAGTYRFVIDAAAHINPPFFFGISPRFSWD